MERDVEISNGKGSLRHWCLGYSQCFSVISRFWYNSLIQQHKQTYFSLSYFNRLLLLRQTPVWHGRSSRNMYRDEPESWNRFAIDSLNCSLSEQIIASLKKKKKMTQVVDDNSIVIQYPIGIKFSMSLALHCGYVNGFSRSKNRNDQSAIQEQINESCIRTKSWTHPPFS